MAHHGGERVHNLRALGLVARANDGALWHGAVEVVAGHLDDPRIRRLWDSRFLIKLHNNVELKSSFQNFLLFFLNLIHVEVRVRPDPAVVVDVGCVGAIAGGDITDAGGDRAAEVVDVERDPGHQLGAANG